MLKRVMMIPPLPRPPPPLLYPSSFSSSSITFLLSFIFLLWIVVSSFPLSLRFFYASISIFKADFLSLVSFSYSALYFQLLFAHICFISHQFSLAHSNIYHLPRSLASLASRLADIVFLSFFSISVSPLPLSLSLRSFHLIFSVSPRT